MNTSSPPIIPIRAPRDLLALIPFILGFHPCESVVILSVDSTTGRMGPLARIGLADLYSVDGNDSRDLTLFDADPVAAVRETLVQESVDTVAIAVYTSTATSFTLTQDFGITHRTVDSDEPDLMGLREIACAIVEPIFTALSEAVTAVSAWLVTPSEYVDLYCDDISCCPVQGRPVADLDTSPVGTQMVYSGYTVAESRSELARIRYVDQRERRASGQAARAWERSKIKMIASEQRYGEGARAWRRACLAQWRDAIDHYQCGQPITRSALGRLATALDDIMIRDAVIVDLIRPGTKSPSGPDPALNALEYPAGMEIGAAVEALLNTERPAIPQRENIGTAVSLLTDVAACARRRHRAPALTILSWLAWWSGEGPRACVLAELALADRPEYTLATLVNSMLTHALAPGWFHAGSKAELQQVPSSE